MCVDVHTDHIYDRRPSSTWLLLFTAAAINRPWCIWAVDGPSLADASTAQHSVGKQRVWRVMAAHNSLFCVQAMPCGAAIRAAWRARRLGTLNRLLLNAHDGDRGAARKRAPQLAQRPGPLLNHVRHLADGGLF